MNSTKINIRPIKDFAYTYVPRDYVLRDILLDERDELGAQEFVAKIDIWLKLLRGKG